MKNAKRIFVCMLILLLFNNACLLAVCAASSDKADAIQLTQAEQAFIEEHPVIYLGVDPTFVPYEFIDSDGTYKGIAADYIDLICERTGLQMVVAEDLTWSEAYEKAVKKEIDVLPCVAETSDREKYFLFSDIYYNFQRAVFVNDSNDSLNALEDLFGKTVAVQTNSSHHSYLSGYDEIGLSLYSTAEDALQAVSNGTEIAFVGNLATSCYLVKSYGITNLKYFPFDNDTEDKSQSLHFAVRDDWPELVGIINKALADINQEEKSAINNKWISIQENSDYSGIIRIVIIAGTVIALILTVSYFWIVRLRKEIAKRKKAQEGLKAAKEEAEQANEVKSLFLARMSHEIRTPLSAIIGMSYLIKKTDVTVTQSIYLDKLNQAARNMLGIINDILDFSKIESGKIEIERISFDLDKVIQRIINITSVKVEEQSIAFTLDKDPNMPIFFFGDPMRIEQILLNVVNNAVKFTEKGSVSLAVRSNLKRDNTYNIEFCVKDTGIGMSKEQVDRLFVPFDQGDSSISRRFGGSGLGLSIVKNLTDLMGGEIEICSVVNEGSTFCVRLPLEADLSKGQTDTKKMAVDCFRNIRALILDKSESTGILLVEYLKSFGIAADLAYIEDDALRLMRKAATEDLRPYNLLIVDFTTPNDGGIEFLKRIKRQSLFNAPSKYILIIPMTREDLFEELETANIDFGITKPIIPSVLYNGIIEIYNINPPEQHEISKKPDTLSAPNPYHILLVEDNKTNQFIAQNILEQAGFRVSKADNGEQGYKFFVDNRQDLDLILMDIHMPVMDGYTASDLIRKVDADIPIVAMTADAIAGVKEKCKSHGIGNYVSKPFEPDQFVETILDVLKKIKLIETPEGDKKSSDKPVLDTEDGIKRIGGDIKIYHLILQEFYNENSSVAEALKESIDAKDYPQAVQIVHKIKSSSGNIGAKTVFESALELQKSLQAENDAEILKWHKTFQSLLNRLLSEIENILIK